MSKIKQNENYIDMRKVCDFSANENSLYLYLNDGTGFYYENY